MADASSSSSAEPLGASWCNTQVKVVKFNYTWTIENFSYCATDTGEAMTSSTFSADPSDEQQPKWRLKLYSKKCVLNEYASLCLELAKHNKPGAVSVKFDSCILNAKGVQCNKSTQTRKFVQGQEGEVCRFNRVFLMDKKNGLLPNDRLTIFCEISIVFDSTNMAGHSKMTTQCHVSKNRMAEDFGALLENGLFADFVLCTGDKEFKAHKAVLACRSPVFAAMFSNDTEEERTNRVEIEDLTAPVLGQLLHFLYTGQAPPLLTEKDMAEGLLAAADKYQLDRLKEICQHQFCAGLNMENVFDVLAIADRHNAEHLKARAIEYICLHADEVQASDGWRTLVSSSQYALLAQVFKALAIHKSQS